MSADPHAAGAFWRRPADAKRLHARVGGLGVRRRTDAAVERESPGRQRGTAHRSSKRLPRHSWSTARLRKRAFRDVPKYPPVRSQRFVPRNSRCAIGSGTPPPSLPRRAGIRQAGAGSGTGRCGDGAECPRVALASGFEPGRIYEIRYRAQNPPVSGVGLAAIRDVASAVKYGNGAIVPARGKYLHVYGARRADASCACSCTTVSTPTSEAARFSTA